MAAAGAAAGCREAVGPGKQDPARCPQTYEFGNVGCARLVVVVVVDGAPAALPARFYFDVRASAVRAGSGLDQALAEPALASALPASPVQLTPTRWWAPAGAGDTVTVSVVARVLDATAPVVNQPLPTVAGDSARRVVRFAAVGAPAPVDTVRLTLRSAAR